MLTTTAAAAKLKVTRRRVIALITAGRLRASKFGNVYMIEEKSLADVRVRKPGRPKGKLAKGKL